MTTTIQIRHSAASVEAEIAYTGNPYEVADFAAKFADFVAAFGPKVEKPHWSGLTLAEREMARQGETRALYGGQPFSSGKIPAIKMHRERTGIGLRDSKDAIEAYLDGIKAGKEV